MKRTTSVPATIDIVTQNGDWVAIARAAADADRSKEIGRLMVGDDPLERAITSVLTIVTDQKETYILEMLRDGEQEPPAYTPQEIEILLRYVQPDGTRGCIALPARFAFWSDDRDAYNIQQVTPIVTQDSGMEPEELGEILTEAYFRSSFDDPAEDPDETELAGFREAALTRARRILEPSTHPDKEIRLELHTRQHENGWTTTVTAKTPIHHGWRSAETRHSGTNQAETQAQAAAKAVTSLLQVGAQN